MASGSINNLNSKIYIYIKIGLGSDSILWNSWPSRPQGPPSPAGQNWGFQWAAHRRESSWILNWIPQKPKSYNYLDWSWLNKRYGFILVCKVKFRVASKSLTDNSSDSKQIWVSWPETEIFILLIDNVSGLNCTWSLRVLLKLYPFAYQCFRFKLYLIKAEETL